MPRFGIICSELSRKSVIKFVPDSILSGIYNCLLRRIWGNLWTQILTPLVIQLLKGQILEVNNIPKWQSKVTPWQYMHWSQKYDLLYTCTEWSNTFSLLKRFEWWSIQGNQVSSQFCCPRRSLLFFLQRIPYKKIGELSKTRVSLQHNRHKSEVCNSRLTLFIKQEIIAEWLN